MTIKTFRGLMADEAIDTVVLHTNDGSMGYRIVKFDLFCENTGGVTQESVVKIYKIPQTGTPTSTANFSDQTLLAVAHIGNSTATSAYAPTLSVVFDKEIFNQDIYITHREDTGSASVNYYIELEQVKLDLSENTVATLKDIRNLETPAVDLNP